MTAGDDLTLDELSFEVARAKRNILELEDDWDGEGSKRISEMTLDRVKLFLENVLGEHQKRTPGRLKIPSIVAGNEGEVEVNWLTDKFRLSIDIPEIHTDPVVYAADDMKGSRIKGTIPFDRAWIVYFMCEEIFA